MWYPSLQAAPVRNAHEIIAEIHLFITATFEKHLLELE